MVTKILNKSHFHVRLIVGGPLVLFACFFIINPVQAVNDESLEKFGDIAQIALPAIGLGATWGYSDKEGAKQWLWTGVTSVGTTTVLKEVYEKVRPNAAQSATSFPSGHTTGAFFGAAFLDQRYGKWWGIPAYTAATITAYSRVVTDHHHVDDTLMGASISLMSSWYWVTPHEGAVSLIPFQQNDAVGVSLYFDGSGKTNDYSGLRDDERWRYAIVFGPAFQNKNLVTAPTSTGTSFNLDDFDKTNDPTTTANAIIEWYSGKHRSLFSIEPFEARDFGRFTQATDFAGETYQPGEELRSSYRMTDVRLQYYYDLMKGSPIILEVGGGVSYQHTTVELATTSETQSSEATSDVWMPLANAAFGYEFNPRLSIVAELSGLSLNSQEQLDANISIGYRLDKYWDAGIGYGIYQHDTESSELSNNVEYDIFMTYVGYSFY